MRTSWPGLPQPATDSPRAPQAPGRARAARPWASRRRALSLRRAQRALGRVQMHLEKHADTPLRSFTAPFTDPALTFGFGSRRFTRKMAVVLSQGVSVKRATRDATLTDYYSLSRSRPPRGAPARALARACPISPIAPGQRPSTSNRSAALVERDVASTSTMPYQQEPADDARSRCGDRRPRATLSTHRRPLSAASCRRSCSRQLGCGESRSSGCSPWFLLTCWGRDMGTQTTLQIAPRGRCDTRARSMRARSARSLQRHNSRERTRYAQHLAHRTPYATMAPRMVE